MILGIPGPPSTSRIVSGAWVGDKARIRSAGGALSVVGIARKPALMTAAGIVSGSPVLCMSRAARESAILGKTVIREWGSRGGLRRTRCMTLCMTITVKPRILRRVIPRIASIQLSDLPGAAITTRDSDSPRTVLPVAPTVVVVRSRDVAAVIAPTAACRFVAAVKPDLHMLPGDPALAPAGGDAVEPDLAQDDHVPQ